MAVRSITTGTPRPEPTTPSPSQRLPEAGRRFAAIRRRAGRADPRNRLWFFVDYEQQLENDPISVINPALAAAGELTAFSSNFWNSAGTALPAPNAPYPVPGNDSAPDPTNPVYLQQVSNTMNALNSNLGIQPRKKNDWCLRPAWTIRPVPATACSSAST
jgi:hypothetical protein